MAPHRPHTGANPGPAVANARPMASRDAITAAHLLPAALAASGYGAAAPTDTEPAGKPPVADALPGAGQPESGNGGSVPVFS